MVPARPYLWQQPQGPSNLFALEKDERVDLGQEVEQKRTTGDHKITHPRAAVAQIPSPDYRLDVLQAVSEGGAL